MLLNHQRISSSTHSFVSHLGLDFASPSWARLRVVQHLYQPKRHRLLLDRHCRFLFFKRLYLLKEKQPRHPSQHSHDYHDHHQLGPRTASGGLRARAQARLATLRYDEHFKETEGVLLVSTFCRRLVVLLTRYQL